MPVNKNFTLTSGTATSEQDLLSRLETFIVTSLGEWVLVATPVNTGTDLRKIFYSDGSGPRFYIHLRATADSLRWAAMTDYRVSGDVQYNSVGSVTDTSLNSLIDTGSSSMTYWFMGNEDFIHVVVSGVSEELHGGFGLWDSYYDPVFDPYPFLVFGQTDESHTFATTDRLRSYGVGAWVTPVNTTLSGTSVAYRAAHNTRLASASPNSRSNSPKFFEPVFYNNATANREEVRGEVPGLYLVGGVPYSLGNVVTVTGTAGQEGDYFIFKLTDNNTWAVGPIILRV
jgi:hypothetical protein